MKLRLAASASALALALCVIPGAVAQEEPEPIPIHVAAYDYGFDMQTAYTAGEYAFTFENTSEDRMHEFVLFKHKTNKSTEKVISIAEKNEQKVDKLMKFIGANRAGPGEQGKQKYNFTANFKEGQRYFYLCLIANSKKAKPHYRKGMLGEFTVQAPTQP